MATKAEYLVNQTVADVTRLTAQIDQARSLVWRIVERMEAIGGAVLDTHVFENNYTKADFVALYTALNNLPDFVIDDATRDDIFNLLSSVQ
jgi:hypothetical protein